MDRPPGVVVDDLGVLDAVGVGGHELAPLTLLGEHVETGRRTGLPRTQRGDRRSVERERSGVGGASLQLEHRLRFRFASDPAERLQVPGVAEPHLRQLQVCAVSVDRDQRGVELGLDEPAERERFSVRQARGKVPEAHGAGTTQTRVPS